jgi:coiled-coil domain-containing protein 12
LKRDVNKRIEKLNRRTQKAIVELIRKRIQEEGEEEDTDEDEEEDD